MERFKNRKLFMVFLVLIIGFSTLAYGDNLENDKEELGFINEKIKDVKELINNGKKKEKTLSNQIANINKKIQSAESEIRNLNSSIIKTQRDIETKNEEIETTKENMATKNESLNARLRVMYKNGEVDVMEVLLGSDDFVDFLSNMDMVKEIYAQDAEMLENMRLQHEMLEKKKADLELLKKNLYAAQEDSKARQVALESDLAEVDVLKQEILKNNKELEKQVDALNAYADEIADRIRKAQSDEAYVGGKMAWPSPGYTRVTSPYGYRIHPVLKTRKMHTGVDLGVPANSSIVSVLDGVVIHANWLGGYGKAVMIDHGGGIVTLYAHNNSIKVTVGQKVKRGQLISKSGSTGMSTGPHLHFEVRENGKHTDPMKWLK